MTKIEIDKEKCIKCGACIKDCISYSLEQGEDRFPKLAKDGEKRCFGCTHCMAICPARAISVNNKNPGDSVMPEIPNPESVLGLIKSRRSIRQYLDTEMSQEMFDKIKEMLPYIPTGCNTNTLHFSFVEKKSVMDYIRNYTRDKLLRILKNPLVPRSAGKFSKFKTAFERGEDIIFRGAPHMIVVSSHVKAPCANVDPIIALSYIELYAKSLGLGTCWCGFAQVCFRLFPKLSELVGIPNNYKPVYVMLLGYSAVKYSGTTFPDEFPVTEIKEINDKKSSWFKNLKRLIFNR